MGKREKYAYLCVCLHLQKEILERKAKLAGLPGGPLVKAPCFRCRGAGSVPSWGTKILQAAQCGQKRERKQKGKTKLVTVVICVCVCVCACLCVYSTCVGV